MTAQTAIHLESVRRVHLDRDGYAPDGRYFGQGAPVWCITLDNSEDFYIRAGDKDAAVQRWLVTMQRYNYGKVTTVTLYHGSPNDSQPRKEVRVPVKVDMLPWQARGLQQTRTGYGRRLTTTKKVFLDGTWKRVYCVCYSNKGTCYTLTKGKWSATLID